MTKGSFLLTRPNHEQTTKYLFEWAKKILEKASEKNILTVDLAGDQVTRGNFTKAIKKYTPSFVYLNGHGSPNEVTGYNEEKQNAPAEDNTAAIFLQPSNDLVDSIINGKLTSEAFENSQEAFTQDIVKYSLSEATAEERELLPYLLWDREHQVCLGDSQTSCEFISEEEFNKQRNIKLFIIFLAIVVLILFVITFVFWK